MDKKPDLPWVIGGHDVAAILGINQHCTPLQLWARKLGVIDDEDISEKPVIVRGHEMEPHLLELYGAVTMRDWRREPEQEHEYTVAGKPPPIPRRHHPDQPWAVAAVDAEVMRERNGRTQLGSLDAKSTSIWIRDKWGDQVDAEVVDYSDNRGQERLPGMEERRRNKRVYPTASRVPLHENIQQQWYLWVKGLPFASFAVGIIDDRAYRSPIQLKDGSHALFGLTDFLWCDVERNEGFIEAMRGRVLEFVECLEKRIKPDYEPNWRDKATIGKILGRETEDQVELDMEAYNLVLRSQRIGATIKAQEQERDRIAVVLAEKIGTAAVGVLPNGNNVTYRTQEAKQIETSYLRKESRILRIPQERHMKPLPEPVEIDPESLVIE